MNLLNNFPRRPGALVSKTYSHTATGSSTTSSSITVPTGRGPVTALQVIFLDGTLTDTDGVTYTISGNGMTIVEDGNATLQSTLFTGDKPDIVPCTIPEGGIVDFRVTNDQATAIPCRIVLYFGS
jgi:hypothetical protein